MKKFKHKVGSLEVRSCDEHLLQTGKPVTAEIVYWNSNVSCYTLAHFRKNLHGEDFDLKFVGSRPFDSHIPNDVFMSIASFGYNKLIKEFDKK